MQKHIYYIIFKLILIIIISTSTIYAGRPDKAGTSAASELLIPVGARSIGLGGSHIATVNGPEAMYWNPAGLAGSSSKNFLFSHMSYIADIGVDYFAASVPLFNLGNLGVAIKSLDVGDIAVTTEDLPDGTGEITSPTFIIVGGTYARQITDRISVGVTSNYIYEKMARVSASTFAVNLGVQYTGIGGIEGLSVGAAVKNLGPSLKFDGAGLLRDADVIDASRQNSKVKIEAAASDLPSTIEIGLGYKVPLLDLGMMNITSTFQNNNYSDDEYKFGAEYIYDNLISVRGGIAITPEIGSSRYIFGESVGAGINYEVSNIRISIDYAYRAVKYFNGNHVFTVMLEY